MYWIDKYLAKTFRNKFLIYSNFKLAEQKNRENISMQLISEEYCLSLQHFRRYQSFLIKVSFEHVHNGANLKLPLHFTKYDALALETVQDFWSSWASNH